MLAYLFKCSVSGVKFSNIASPFFFKFSYAKSLSLLNFSETIVYEPS